MKKFISILVPYYNEGESVVKHLLDSIAVQQNFDMSELEVIVNAVIPPNLYPEQNTGIYNQFENNAPGRKIKVPAKSLQAYKTAPGWSDYADDIIAQ